MMHRLQLAVIFCALAASAFGRAAAPEPLATPMLLQELSLKLRGNSPTAAEVSEFRTRLQGRIK